MILTTPASSISPVGTYPIVATSATSTNYAITFHDGTLAVAQAATVTAMVVPISASVFGQAVTFTALVSPARTSRRAPSRSSSRGDGRLGVVIPHGHGDVHDGVIGVGNHTLSAAYTGNTNFLAGQSGGPAVVNPAAARPSRPATAVRNRRGRIVAVSLDASVLPNRPAAARPPARSSSTWADSTQDSDAEQRHGLG